MKKEIIFIFGILFLIGIISQVNAIYVDDNLTINNMGHAIRVQSIHTIPSEIAPGSSGILNIELINNAKFPLDDLIVGLDLPSGINVLNDVNSVKRSRLNPLESVNISFNIIVSPSATEGIYDGSISIDYISYLGVNYANVGEEKTETNEFSIIVKDVPQVFELVDTTTIYEGNYLGDVGVKLVNHGVGNIKFLTVELLESEDYEIISGGKKYIGDLDSDDFDSADFRLNIKNKKNPVLLLRLNYKDSLNQDYSENVSLPLEIKSAKELGISTGSNTRTVGIIVVLGIIGYFLYKKFRKKKKRVIEL